MKKTVDSKIKAILQQAQTLNDECKRLEELAPSFFKDGKVDILALLNYINSIPKHNMALNKLQRCGFDIISLLIVEWFKSKPFISVHALENSLKVPSGTISNAISSKTGRNIPPKYLPDLIILLKEYGF